MINENSTPSRQNALRDNGRSSGASGASGKRGTRSSAKKSPFASNLSSSELLDVIDDISGLQEELSTRRQTLEGGTDALQNLLDTSTVSSVASQSKLKSRSNRRSTVDPADFDDLLNGLDESSQSIVSSMGAPASPAPSSMRLDSAKSTPQLSTRKSPRFKSSQKSLSATVSTGLGSGHTSQQRSGKPSNRRETVDANELAAIMQDLNNSELSFASEAPSTTASVVNVSTVINSSAANTPKSANKRNLKKGNNARRQTFEGGIEALNDLLDSSDVTGNSSSHINAMSTHNAFELEENEDERSVAVKDDSRATIDAAELGSLLDGQSYSDSITANTNESMLTLSTLGGNGDADDNDDGFEVAADTGTVVAEESMDVSMEALINISQSEYVIERQCTPHTVAAPSVASCQQSNGAKRGTESKLESTGTVIRRETADPADLAQLMDDLIAERMDDRLQSGYDFEKECTSGNPSSSSALSSLQATPDYNTRHVSRTSTHKSNQNKNKIGTGKSTGGSEVNRRATADPQDMLSIMRSLENEELQLQQSNPASRSVSAVGSPHPSRSMPVGRESIDTVALMQSVAEILNDLEGNPVAAVNDANDINDAASDVSSISAASSVRKFRVYNQQQEAQHKQEQHEIVGGAKDIDNDTVNTMELLNDIKQTLGEEGEDEEVEEDPTVGTSFGSICGLLNQIDAAHTENDTNMALSSPKVAQAPMLAMGLGGLRSCMSNHKSAKKSVIFGSPTVAEFNKSSPTTRFTPLTKAQSRGLFLPGSAAMASTMPAYAENESTSVEVENEDPLTNENSQILDEWDRLTTASSPNVGSDDETSLSMSVSNTPDKSSSMQAVKRGRLMQSQSPIPAIASDAAAAALSAVKSLDSKRSKRRQSMLQPTLSHTDDFNDANEESLSMSMISVVSEASHTVALPSNLAQLLDDPALVSTTAALHSTKPNNYNNDTSELLGTSYVSQTDDRTQELETDLQTLMRRVNYANTSIDFQFQDDCDSASLGAHSVGSEKSRKSAASSNAGSERSLNTILGGELQAMTQDEQLRLLEESRELSMTEDSCTVQLEGKLSDLLRQSGQSSDAKAVAATPTARFSIGSSVASPKARSSLGEQFDDDLASLSVSMMSENNNLNGDEIENEVEVGNEVESIVDRTFDAIRSASVPSVNRMSMLPHQQQPLPVPQMDAKASGILSKLRALNAISSAVSASAAAGTPGRMSMSQSAPNRMSILQSAQQKAARMSMSSTAPVALPPPLSSHTAIASNPTATVLPVLPTMPASIEQSTNANSTVEAGALEQSPPLLPSYDALMSAASLHVVASSQQESFDLPQPAYAHSALSIDAFVQSFLARATDLSVVHTIATLLSDLIKAAIAEAKAQCESQDSVARTLWQKATSQPEPATITFVAQLQQSLVIEALSGQCKTLTDHNWLLWETRLMHIATEAVEKYTIAAQSRLEETRQRNMNRAGEIEAMVSQRRNHSDLVAQQAGQVDEIEALRREIALAKGQLETVETATTAMLEDKKNAVLANVAARMATTSSYQVVKPEQIPTSVTTAPAVPSTHNTLSSEELQMLRSKNAQLAEIKKSHSIINRLTYCRVVSYSSAEMALEAVLTSQFRVSMVVQFDGADVSNILVDVEIRGSADDRENLLAQSYFVNVMCADELSGPLSGKTLELFKYPKQIPALLLKISGYVAVLRRMMVSLQVNYADKWSIEGADVITVDPFNSQKRIRSTIRHFMATQSAI